MSDQSVGHKYDAGKAPLVQGCLHYFPKALEAVAHVSDYGRKKYKVEFSERNFMKVEDGAKRYLDACGRHLAAEGADAESGLSHAWHAAWNALAYIELSMATNALINEYAGPPPKPTICADKKTNALPAHQTIGNKRWEELLKAHSSPTTYFDYPDLD